MNWIKHNIINTGYLAAQLYGQSNPSTRSQISKKIRGERKWQDWELTRLQAIRTELLQALNQWQWKPRHKLWFMKCLQKINL